MASTERKWKKKEKREKKTSYLRRRILQKGSRSPKRLVTKGIGSQTSRGKSIYRTKEDRKQKRKAYLTQKGKMRPLLICCHNHRVTCDASQKDNQARKIKKAKKKHDTKKGRVMAPKSHGTG